MRALFALPLVLLIAGCGALEPWRLAFHDGDFTWYGEAPLTIGHGGPVTAEIAGTAYRGSWSTDMFGDGWISLTSATGGTVHCRFRYDSGSGGGQCVDGMQRRYQLTIDGLQREAKG